MATEQTSNSQRLYAQLVAKALADPAFKSRLIAQPATVLAEHGIKVPDGITLRVLEDTAALRHLVLPAAPENLTDDQLDGVAGGAVLLNIPLRYI